MALINYLTQIEFDVGAVRLLPEKLATLNIARPLLVSDRGLAATGLVERILALLPAGSASFLDVPTNPTEAAAQAGLAVYRGEGCDGIVALGGGSPIDLSKAIALAATHPAPLDQYAAIKGGAGRITAAVAPVIAIPTTAGTGAEVGRAALITFEGQQKLGLISPHLIPKVALCDPSLLLGLPRGLTAATGMDALSHCIETYCSPRINPPADAIALDGLGRLWRNLERAVQHGDDLQARSEVMMGALEGGLTFQKGLGAVHSLSHALGGLDYVALHHGTLNALLMPAVLRFNASSLGKRLDLMKQAADLPATADLADEIDSLNRRIGLTRGLGELGVRESDIEWISGRALLDHSQATNPRPMTIGDMGDLLRACW